MSSRMGTFVFLLVISVFIAGFVGFVGSRIKADTARSDRCEQLGGQMIRWTCVDKSVIIDVEEK